jgi:hypothetical protein
MKVSYKQAPEWAAWLRNWIYESPDWVPEVVDRVVLRALCAVHGHHPISDQCGIPEHDFCVYCMRSTPNQARDL